MRNLRLTGSIHHKWVLVFFLWTLFLSGIPAQLIGSPGILQASRLDSLRSEKTIQLSDAENEVKKLKTEAELLEKNKHFQLREIRKTLGYAASDELIFEFN